MNDHLFIFHLSIIKIEPTGTFGVILRFLILWFLIESKSILPRYQCCDFNSLSGQTFWIEENILEGTLIGRLSTPDDLNRDFQTCLYTSLADSHISKYFSVNPKDGSIVTTKPIDREALCDSRTSTLSTNDQLSKSLAQDTAETNLINKRQTFPCQIQFQVLISDTRNLESSSSVIRDVQIMIADLNDNKPQFFSDHIVLKIPETSPIDAEYRLPQAHDPDSGNHGIVEYKLERCTKEDNDSTCTKLHRQLAEKSHTKSIHPSYTTDLVHPIRSPSDYAGDYFILKTHYQPDGNLQPALKQSSLLDRETLNYLYFCLVSMDGGGKQGRLCGMIEVMDVNDNVPQWIGLPYRVTIPECDNLGNSVGMSGSGMNFLSTYTTKHYVPKLVYTLEAHDPDSGLNGQITYRFAYDNYGKTNLHSLPKFTLKDNKVYLNSKLDYEQMARLMIPVEAIDGGGLSNFTEIEVWVEDCNDHAPSIMIIPLQTHLQWVKTVPNKRITSVPLLWIEEEQLGRVGLATITAVDRDNKDAGKIRCYFEIASNYQRFDYTQLFELVQTGTFRYGHNQSRSNQMSSLNSTQSVNPSIFTLYKREGMRIDREELSSLLVDIVCTDNGQPNQHITRKTIRLVVLDINDHAPEFPSNLPGSISDSDGFPTQIMSVPENQPFGTLVGTVIATDQDEGPNARLIYSLVTDSNLVKSSDILAPESRKVEELFDINPETGQIYTRLSLDRETKSSYLITVRATDSGEQSLSSTVLIRINVADVNDCPPIFETTDLSGRILFQTTESNGNRRVHSRLVGRLVATDNDLGENKTIRFDFVNGSLSPGGLPFSYRVTLDGHVYADGVLDREAYSEHQFIVTATDNGPKGYQLTSSAMVLVKLLDVNDNSPKFTNPSSLSSSTNKIPSDLINLTVDSVSGSILYRIQATDIDEPQNSRIRFALHSARFLSDCFTLKPSEPVIHEGSGYTEASADLILVNPLTQLLPALKLTALKEETNDGRIYRKNLIQYPTEYFLYIIAKDSLEENGHTSTARIRIHVYQDIGYQYATANAARTGVGVTSAADGTGQKYNGSNHQSASLTLDEQSGVDSDLGALNELQISANIYDDSLVRPTSTKPNNMTLIMIMATIIICAFMGVFCSIAYLYIRGALSNRSQLSDTNMTNNRHGDDDGNNTNTLHHTDCTMTDKHLVCATDRWTNSEEQHEILNKTLMGWDNSSSCTNPEVRFAVSQLEDGTLNSRNMTYYVTTSIPDKRTVPLSSTPIVETLDNRIKYIYAYGIDQESSNRLLPNLEQKKSTKPCNTSQDNMNLTELNDSSQNYTALSHTTLTSDYLRSDQFNSCVTGHLHELYHPSSRPNSKQPRLIRNPVTFANPTDNFIHGPNQINLTSFNREPNFAKDHSNQNKSPRFAKLSQDQDPLFEQTRNTTPNPMTNSTFTSTPTSSSNSSSFCSSSSSGVMTSKTQPKLSQSNPLDRITETVSNTQTTFLNSVQYIAKPNHKDDRESSKSEHNLIPTCLHMNQDESRTNTQFE